MVNKRNLPEHEQEKIGLGVSLRRVLAEEARVNHDGTPSETLEYGVIKRKIKTMGGNIKNQFLTKDYYVIPDINKYNKYQKTQPLRDKTDQITEAFAEMEAPGKFRNENPAEAAEYDGNTGLTEGERIDRAAARALDRGEMIRLDDAFPDIGDLSDDDDAMLNPAVRARVAALHGSQYQREYILRTLHRLVLRRTPTDTIAQMFNVPVNRVYKWIEELNRRLQKEATSITLGKIAGDTLAFYNESRSMGLILSESSEKMSEKIRGLEVALKAEQDKHKFLQVAGFYDNARLGRDDVQDENQIKAERILEMTKNLMSGHFEVDEEGDLEEEDENNIIL